jgi:hypothetical protein
MKRFLAVCLLVVFGSTALVAQTPSPSSKLVGVWKRNVAKSTYNTGTKPGPESVSVYQWTIRPDGFLVGTIVTIAADGTPTFNQTVSKYDGKDYSNYGNASLADLQASGAKAGTMAYKVLDEYSVQLTAKGPDGNVTAPNQTRIRTVSQDGKTMTDVTKGMNAQGQPINNVLVFDRMK